MAETADLAAGLAGQTVAVTGAAGFIGGALVAALCDGGARVRVLLRGRDGIEALRTAGAEVVRGDLDAELPPAFLSGADLLIHTAYDLRAPGPRNLQAGAGLFAAAEAEGIGRIVHLSSVVVYDDWPDARLDESCAWGSPGGGGYRQAKIALERRLLDSELPSAILQPTLVYGPGSALWTVAPLAALARGPVMLPDPPGLCPLVHVADVVQALLRAAILPGLGRAERFLISGPDSGLDWADFYRALAERAGGGSVRLQPMPAPMPGSGPGSGSDAPDAGQGVPLAARVGALGRRILGRARFEALVAQARSRLQRGGPVWPDPFLLSLYRAHPEIDLSRAAERLGYRPDVDFATGLMTIRNN